MQKPDFTAKGILLVFVLCAGYDFVRGYMGHRSIPTGVLTVICGLFGTAFYLFFFWLSGKDKDNSDGSHR
jgi:hypothetical protein